MVEKLVLMEGPQKLNRCPLCAQTVPGPLRAHIIGTHGEAGLRKAVLADKERGMPDSEIGARYGISFSTVERFVTEAYGANISVLTHPKRIKRWAPPDFREENTTLWSFKQRGDWATHDGRYRGNWSPYIPRNVILKYSQPGDVVLDYFVGGGTTAVEAKLLGRRCIARDINPGAVGITLENLRFSPPCSLYENRELPVYEPQVAVGDARDLSDIPDGAVDLICAHPPYAGIIRYTTQIPADLSSLSVEDFLNEMRKVAGESLRVLKPGGKCAILIGDARSSKYVVPIGFETIQVFLDAGFVLRELVIKRQHNCRTTGFWYTRSIRYNFLLLAHEYLPIFEKPVTERVAEPCVLGECSYPYQITHDQTHKVEKNKLETTTVWLFPSDRLEDEVRRNILGRFTSPGDTLVEVQWCHSSSHVPPSFPQRAKVVHMRLPERLEKQRVASLREEIREIVKNLGSILSPGGFLVIEAKDFRAGRELVPVGLQLWEDLNQNRDFVLKEIVVVAPEDRAHCEPQEYLHIVHRYLLFYSKSKHQEEQQ